MSKWKLLKDAPLDVEGTVWSPLHPERLDFQGTVKEYHDGERFVVGHFSGMVFTHWHPYPDRPEV